MSKNLTRKGLVFGAVIALTSTVIAGSPALAANEVTLTPSAGTSYSLISGETYTLTAATGSLIPSSSYSRLKTKVTNNSSIAYTTGATQAGASFSGTGSNLASVASVVVKDSDGAGATASSAAITVAVAASAAGNFSVQSWLDDNGNDAIDAGEFSSETRTVTFIKPADVTATTAITAPVEGDTTVTATVKFNDINNEQLPAAHVGAYFTKGNDAALASNTTSSVVRFNTTWSATDFFKFTTATVTALVKDTAVKVQPLYKLTNVADTDAAATIGASATATVVARKAATIVASAVVSTTASSTESLLNSSFALQAVVKDAATTPVAVANQAVTAVVSTSATLTATAPAKTLTVNGTSYSSNAALPGTGSVAKLALTTNAAGEAIVNLTTAGFAAGETVTVSFTTENLSASAITSTQRAATYTATVDNQSAVASVADNGTANVAVSVRDQFGGAPADKYDVTATLTGSTQATTTASVARSNSNVALVGGKATIGLVEDGTGNGTNTYNLEVKERLSGSQYGSSVVTAVPYSVKIVAATALVPGAVTSSTGTQNSTTKIYEVAGPVALSLNDVKNADTRKVVETAPTVTNNQALAGTVTTASSATQAAVAIAGASVTLSGTGLQFYAGSVYAGSSLTVATDSTGAWAANVTSNKAGKQTITVTSGSATATITVVFAAAASTTGTVITFTNATSITPGKTLTYTGKLTDKYGNPVATSSSTADFKVAYSGPGFVVATLPTETDSAGTFTVSVLLGAADTGVATLTATYGGSKGAYDSTVTGSTADIVKSSAVAVGNPEVAVRLAASTKKFYVGIDNAKGLKVVVKVAGKTVKSFTASSAKQTAVIASAKGKKSVKVYVDGDLVVSKTLTIK